ncbi:hypothetical protein NB716_004549 [Pantoea ananatis]|nr:hypothetical protein [Pantoea ananatis]
MALPGLFADLLTGRRLARIRFFPVLFSLLLLFRTDLLHVIIRSTRRFNCALCFDNIAHLTANLANHLRGLQPLLFFLFVKDRADAVVGMRRVTTQRGGMPEDL